MRHHVVGVCTDEEVREQPHVQDLPELPAGQAADRRAQRPAAHRHGVGVVHQVHVPAGPAAGRHVVQPALDRRHLAQRRVDLGAVVALVVVLDDQLPVRRDLVRVRSADHQAPGFVPVDPLREVPHVLLERRRVGRGVHEHPAVPFGHADLGQRELAAVEPGQLAERRRRAQGAVQPVDPGVVRAPDDPGLRAPTAGEQLVAAVAADVGEATEQAVVAPREQHPLGAQPDGALLSGGRQIGAPADADPSLVEERPALPRQDLGGEVRLGGKGPVVAERRQCPFDGGRVDRGLRGHLA